MYEVKAELDHFRTKMFKNNVPQRSDQKPERFARIRIRSGQNVPGIQIQNTGANIR